MRTDRGKSNPERKWENMTTGQAQQRDKLHCDGQGWRFYAKKIEHLLNFSIIFRINEAIFLKWLNIYLYTVFSSANILLINSDVKDVKLCLPEKREKKNVSFLFHSVVFLGRI